MNQMQAVAARAVCEMVVLSFIKGLPCYLLSDVGLPSVKEFLCVLF